ncbi:hypothetical protein O0880_15985 [Janthinobacterium sp. SUN118]|uniref:DUF6701 domain-containing protein n=1 Tax=Janthinobacterium sp. SUN118 TaxID=3004100 RepID=UPI0025B1ACC8|nr:DUF6701 domain-containing protein [Janthinobacterium sp. SUN118]MDN2710921.1 hypothetical protein [Janthinobacterium sp. SUN118]
MRAYTFLAGLFFLLWTGLVQAATLSFNGNAVGGCTLAGMQYTCAALPLGDTDVVVIASAYGVTVNSSLTMKYNQGLTMSGSAALTVKGNLDIKDINPPNLKVTGGNLTAEGGTFSMGAQEQTLSASIAATTIKMGSNNVKVTGSISAKGLVEIASGSVINGPISGATVNILAASSRIQGDITATTSITIGSGSQVTGDLTAPNIDLKASGLLVTGDVKASNTLTIASGNGIKGDVEGGNVTLDASNAYITGNAVVDHITLGWQGRVQQTITCKAYTPSNPCSCVTNNSGWGFNEPQGPKCGPSTQAGPHHFQITHPPAALTCAPAPVTVTACADAACSSVYTGAAQVTLTPGGATAQINGSLPATGMAVSSVAQTTAAGNVALGLSSTPATTGALVCKSSVDNSLTNCQMAFVTSALQVSGAPRYAEQEGRIAISALQASASNPRACVPLFASQTKTLQLRCTYANPTTGTLPARIQNKDNVYVPLGANAGSACSAAGAAVQLAFDADGQATPNLLYADAGALGLTATYASTSGSDSGLTMTGTGTVIVGPKAFAFSAIATPQRAGMTVLPVAPATSISVSALNAAGAVTRNFGRETLAQTVELGRTIVAPVFPGFSDPAVAGSLTFNNNNGVGTAANLSWPEVGQIRFTASLATYLGAAAPQLPATGSSADVLYIPHHYKTEIIVPGETDLPPTAVFAAPCTAAMKCLVGVPPAGVSAYSGQAFGLRVTAQNQANASTLNFDGRDTSYMTAVQVQGWDAAKGEQLFPPGTPGASRLTDGSNAQTTVTSIAATKFTLGVARSALAYRFPGASGVPVMVAPTDVLLRASSTNGGASVSSAPAAAGSEGVLTVLSGRLMVPHGYGSERYPVRLPVQAQYWDGKMWSINLADSGSKFTQAQVLLANCKKTLDCAALQVEGGTYTVNKGELPKNKLLTIQAPGAGKVGSVEVSVPGMVYLPSTVGIVVFGVFKSGPVIYLREMY